MMTIGIFISFLIGVVATATSSFLVKTENVESFTSLDHHTPLLPSLVENIVDSRFKLLAKDFQDQIDDLKGKVVQRESSKSTEIITNTKDEQHEIKKRQTNISSKPKRPNINSACTFYYPDHPDAVLDNDKSSHHVANKKFKNASKLPRPVCENSSAFCTFSHPDHHDASGRKTSSYTPTVKNEMVVEDTTSNVEAFPTSRKDHISLETNDNSEADRNKPTVNNEILPDPTKVKGMPTSCKDLQLLGHKLNGIYLIKTLKPGEGVKIEAVFCDFQSITPVSVSQELIGSVKITTKNAFFYVQRDTSFTGFNEIITFELARLNEGGAFNLSSGIFTAPVPGIFHFEFHVVKDYTTPYLDVILQVNDNTLGTASINLLGKTGTHDSCSMSASVRLKAGDRVNMFNLKNSAPERAGILKEVRHLHLTHFSGWLLEEDLM